LKPSIGKWCAPGRPERDAGHTGHFAARIDAEEKNLIAAAVVEIFVRQHKGLGVFKFTKLPMKDDYLCLPSAYRRGRLNRYVVTDVVAQNADPERMSENTAEPLHACVYVSFCDEI
jgi:hypothetical protein